jgi:hypothetical protein
MLFPLLNVTPPAREMPPVIGTARAPKAIPKLTTAPSICFFIVFIKTRFDQMNLFSSGGAKGKEL